MGGAGSGNWLRVNRKCRVDEVIELDVSYFKKEGFLEVGKSGYLRWMNGRDCYATIHCLTVRDQIEFFEDDCPYPELRLTFEWQSQRFRKRLNFEATKPHFGGERLWFLCPGQCGLRVRKLYLLGPDIACRKCHDLTYESCQHSHDLERMFEKICRRNPEYDLDFESFAEWADEYGRH